MSNASTVAAPGASAKPDANDAVVAAAGCRDDQSTARRRILDARLDDALAGTFPASDPIAVGNDHSKIVQP
jgi:hypothetical protein